MRQMKFDGIPNNQLHFGGETLVGKRKTLRPLSYSKPLHLTIAPEEIDRSYSFKKYQTEIETLIFKCAKKFGVTVHDKSINFTHIHLLSSFGSRQQYVGFIRLFNSLLIKLLETKTGKSMKGLFKLRPYTRIVHWGRDFRGMLRYSEINRLEAEGVCVRPKYFAKE